ncbi:unnamed protein product [Caenorhabditis angaria]|uniref:Uncharacterized protein n=1 Tax=Caenorhabditis angaria TaxID=860376 RepID=A0A9P1IMT1_9PELO|nr:unnamed protein product [Caenorhabditis angaria]
MNYAILLATILAISTIHPILSSALSNPNPNPNCSPKSNKTKYDDSLFVFVIDRVFDPLKIASLKYIFKQFACDIPISNNIKSHILHIGSDSITTPVKEVDLVNNDGIVKKLDSTLANQTTGANDFCSRLNIHIKSFENEPILKNRKNIQYIMLLEVPLCINVSILMLLWTRLLIIFYEYRIDSNLFVIMDEYAMLPIKTTDPESPQLHLLTERIVSQSLANKSPAPTVSKSESQFSIITLILIPLLIILIVLLVVFSICALLDLKRRRKKLKKRKNKSAKSKKSSDSKDTKTTCGTTTASATGTTSGTRTATTTASATGKTSGTRTATTTASATGKTSGTKTATTTSNFAKKRKEAKKKNKKKKEKGNVKDAHEGEENKPEKKKKQRPKDGRWTPSQKEKHAKYMKNKAKQHAEDTNLRKRLPPCKFIKLDRVYFDESLNERHIIGTEVDDIELDKDTIEGQSSAVTSSAADEVTAKK